MRVLSNVQGAGHRCQRQYWEGVVSCPALPCLLHRVYRLALEVEWEPSFSEVAFIADCLCLQGQGCLALLRTLMPLRKD